MAVESTDTTSYMVVRNDDGKPVVTCDVMATKINSFIAVKRAEGAYPLEINYSDMEKAVGLLEYSHGVMRILEGGAAAMAGGGKEGGVRASGGVGAAHSPECLNLLDQVRTQIRCA